MGKKILFGSRVSSSNMSLGIRFRLGDTYWKVIFLTLEFFQHNELTTVWGTVKTFSHIKIPPKISRGYTTSKNTWK